MQPSVDIFRLYVKECFLEGSGDNVDLGDDDDELDYRETAGSSSHCVLLPVNAMDLNGFCNL